MKKIGLLITLLFGLYGSVSAQTDSTENYVFGGFLIMPIEFPIMDTKALNHQLERYGLPKANNATANIGIGLQLYLNRFITTLSYNQTTRKKDRSGFVTEVEYRATSFNVGYSLTKSQSFSVYPYAGFKGAGLNYLYREKATDTTSFGNYLRANLNHKEVTNSRAHVDLGLGLSHQRYYLVNFRFGYLLPMEKVRWNINNNKTTLPDSPNVTYGYYFTLTLGVGNIAGSSYARQHNRRR